MGILTNTQYEAFYQALLSAFPSKARLGRMVRFRLDINLNEISEATELRQVVFDLIEEYESQDQTPQLLTAARESAPNNSKLLDLAQQLDLASVSANAFESMVKPALKLLDPTIWREHLGRIEAQVCCITVESDNGTIFGTGFLLGPDVVMTNYHVMDAVIEDEQGRANSRGQRAKPQNVTLLFDYKRYMRKVINPGTPHHLATDWLVAYSPFSPSEDQPGPKVGLPKPDELDYALLRVEGEPGSRPAGQKADPQDPPRGWIAAPTKPYAFTPNFALSIMQHPQGDPLKLAFDTDSEIKLNENRTRVTYKTNTGKGSSGSPCFDINWNLVALHHWGDPNFNPAYNEGVPFSAITDHLKAKDKLAEVTKPPPELES